MMQDFPPPMPYEYHRIGLEVANAVKGRPFDHQGRTPQGGFDCAGLLYYWFTTLGLPIELPTEAFTYHRDFWKRGGSQVYLACLEEIFALIPERMASFGDIIVFKPSKDDPTVGHAGIVINADTGEFLHSYHRRGVATNCHRERYWQSLTFGFMRHREMRKLVETRGSVPGSMRV